MVFRLPTHVEPFALPPSELVPQSGPWRGSLIASGLRASDKESTQDLSVTAVETDGDKCVSPTSDDTRALTTSTFFPVGVIFGHLFYMRIRHTTGPSWPKFKIG